MVQAPRGVRGTTITVDERAASRRQPPDASCDMGAFELELLEGFVPEPGTLMLLGSGLAGLGGYATFRLRSGRERRRTRE